MGKAIIKIKHFIKAVYNSIITSYYVKKYYNSKIDTKIILLESKHGEDFAGNILALVKKLDAGYDEFKLYLTCVPKKRNQISKLISSCNLQRVRLVSPYSLKYFRLLASAEYLFTDTSFTTRYIKKQGQIITNTWHGTPIKYMGRDVQDSAYSMGNIERNLLFADYLIFPNEFMKEKMISAYMLDGVFKGAILNEGYPRNSIFFNQTHSAETKAQLGVQDKELFIYMPTWRGNLVNKQNQSLISTLNEYFEQLDKKMSDNQILMVKLHPFVDCDFDYSKYSHIIPMSKDVDTYEVLNCADCLITDYSSVFFDFAITHKKIILFIYDEKDYIQSRGLYINLDSLPFPKAHNANELYEYMCCPKSYDDSEFLKLYCTYDNPDSADNILRHIIKNEQICNEEHILDTSRDNVLIFTGSLAKNGITTAVLSLFDNLDTAKRRYYATFQEATIKAEPLRVTRIPKSIRILPMSTKPQYSITEAVAMFVFYVLNINSKWSIRHIDKMCKRNIEKFFGGVDFSNVIQYEGYGKNMIHLFKNFNCKTSIFVHNNMLNELKGKNNQHYYSLKNSYAAYTTIACVTKDLVESTKAIGGAESNIVVVNNCHSYQSVIERSHNELSFDGETISTQPIEEVNRILNSDATKIINIGRFSHEKGHDMLIAAFEKFASQQKDCYLFIVGGYGKLYNKILNLAENSIVSDRIVIIRSLANPMPLLKKCDLFVLSSRYEGLGLTLLEADTLGLPIISTEVCGPLGFMKKYGGHMVPPTVEGIYQGLKDFSEGKVQAINVDYCKYNENAIRQFENLFS